MSSDFSSVCTKKLTFNDIINARKKVASIQKHFNGLMVTYIQCHATLNSYRSDTNCKSNVCTIITNQLYSVFAGIVPVPCATRIHSWNKGGMGRKSKNFTYHKMNTAVFSWDVLNDALNKTTSPNMMVKITIYVHNAIMWL